MKGPDDELRDVRDDKYVNGPVEGMQVTAGSSDREIDSDLHSIACYSGDSGLNLLSKSKCSPSAYLILKPFRAASALCTAVSKPTVEVTCAGPSPIGS